MCSATSWVIYNDFFVGFIFRTRKKLILKLLNMIHAPLVDTINTEHHRIL